MEKFNIGIHYCKYKITLFYVVFTDDIAEFKDFIMKYIGQTIEIFYYHVDFSKTMETLVIIKAVDNNYYVVEDNVIYNVFEVVNYRQDKGVL